MFIYFSANKLISKNQSGFQPGNSCINQLLSITYEIFTSLDNGLEVRSVFLDISKAFDKVWHEWLIFKLKQNGIFGELLHILSEFLSNRKQRVVLNSQNSSLTNAHGGVPRGSIPGPLLFLIYINDLSDNLTSNAKLFADDTSLFSVVHDVNTSAKELNDDSKKVNDQAFNNSFKEKLESFQYNACLALTGAIRGMSKEKIYQELGLESLRDRRWCRKLCLFFKILENENPKYLFSLIPTRRSLYSGRNIHNIPLVNTKHDFFKNPFFPSTIIEWNKVDPDL